LTFHWCGDGLSKRRVNHSEPVRFFGASFTTVAFDFADGMAAGDAAVCTITERSVAPIGAPGDGTAADALAALTGLVFWLRGAGS
jgi:hypothetical protein